MNVKLLPLVFMAVGASFCGVSYLLPDNQPTIESRKLPSLCVRGLVYFELPDGTMALKYGRKGDVARCS
jgi:hypothetical protein